MAGEWSAAGEAHDGREAAAHPARREYTSSPRDPYAGASNTAPPSQVLPMGTGRAMGSPCPHQRG